MSQTTPVYDQEKNLYLNPDDNTYLFKHKDEFYPIDFLNQPQFKDFQLGSRGIITKKSQDPPQIPVVRSEVECQANQFLIETQQDIFKLSYQEFIEKHHDIRSKIKYLLTHPTLIPVIPGDDQLTNPITGKKIDPNSQIYKDLQVIYKVVGNKFIPKKTFKHYYNHNTGRIVKNDGSVIKKLQRQGDSIIVSENNTIITYHVRQNPSRFDSRMNITHVDPGFRSPVDHIHSSIIAHMIRNNITDQNNNQQIIIVTFTTNMNGNDINHHLFTTKLGDDLATFLQGIENIIKDKQFVYLGSDTKDFILTKITITQIDLSPAGGCNFANITYDQISEINPNATSIKYLSVIIDSQIRYVRNYPSFNYNCGIIAIISFIVDKLPQRIKPIAKKINVEKFTIVNKNRIAQQLRKQFDLQDEKPLNFKQMIEIAKFFNIGINFVNINRRTKITSHPIDGQPSINILYVYFHFFCLIDIDDPIHQQQDPNKIIDIDKLAEFLFDLNYRDQKLKPTRMIVKDDGQCYPTSQIINPHQGLIPNRQIAPYLNKKLQKMHQDDDIDPDKIAFFLSDKYFSHIIVIRQQDTETKMTIPQFIDHLQNNHYHALISYDSRFNEERNIIDYLVQNNHQIIQKMIKQDFHNCLYLSTGNITFFKILGIRFFDLSKYFNLNFDQLRQQYQVPQHYTHLHAIQHIYLENHKIIFEKYNWYSFNVSSIPQLAYNSWLLSLWQNSSHILKDSFHPHSTIYINAFNPNDTENIDKFNQRIKSALHGAYMFPLIKSFNSDPNNMPTQDFLVKLDISSCYPSVMYNNPYPLGSPITFTKNQINFIKDYVKENGYYPLGFYSIDYLTPPDQVHQIPIFPSKHQGRLSWRHYLEKQNGVFSSVLINHALKTKIHTILDIKGAYIWVDKTFFKKHSQKFNLVATSITNGLFDKFVEDNYIDKETSDCQHHKMIAKFKLNSLYGKLIEKSINTNNKFIENIQQLEQLIKDDQREIVSITTFPESSLINVSQDQTEKFKEFINQPQYGVLIIDYARVKMHKLFPLFDVYNIMTDCIFVKNSQYQQVLKSHPHLFYQPQEIKQPSHLLQYKLGKLVNEMPDAKIIQADFFRPNICRYTYMDKDGQTHHVTKYPGMNDVQFEHFNKKTQIDQIIKKGNFYVNQPKTVDNSIWKGMDFDPNTNRYTPIIGTC